MSRFKMTLEYEGTRYSGWQIQQNARTVQGEIAKALETALGSRQFELYGAGRTDAGVHALEQVAHLEARTMLAPHILQQKINDALPADINILRIDKAHKNFHARRDAVARQYVYQISRRRTAFGKRFVWWIKDSLDIDPMRRAAEIFRGKRDFRSFTADNPNEKSTTTTIDVFSVEEEGNLILLRIRGSHFLWKMVRQMVGVLAEVGRGAMDVGEVHRFFEDYSPIPAKLTAPPSGLFLERVYYKDDERNDPLGGTRPMMRIQ
jgi:tRNA pseudouridine38-40 synthase